MLKGDVVEPVRLGGRSDHAEYQVPRSLLILTEGEHKRGTSFLTAPIGEWERHDGDVERLIGRYMLLRLGPRAIGR